MVRRQSVSDSSLWNMKKYPAYLLFGICFLLIIFVAYVNIDAIVGAFGDGPPYYGRTTNMDKWQNPLPKLFVIDAITITLVFLVMRWIRRQLRP